MAESTIGITPGSGQKLHSWQRVIGANTVDEEVMLLGEPMIPSYTAGLAGISIATATDHLLQIMAGASLHVRIYAIWAQQSATGTAGVASFDLIRLTTAGTGGTGVTPTKNDTNDAAAGAAGLSITTVKGTEGTIIRRFRLPIAAANPVTYSPWPLWFPQIRMKPLVIPAGTANGLVFKNVTALAATTIDLYVDFEETSYL